MKTIVAVLFLSGCSHHLKNIYKKLDGQPGKKTVRRVHPLDRIEKKKARPSAKDLEDNQFDGSLWNHAGDDFLFTKTARNSPGDIIVIQVHNDLKNKIIQELQMAFPVKKISRKNPGKTPAKPSDNVHDRITTKVVDKINDKYLLVKGRKYLIYKKKKHLIEVKAMVSQNHIRIDDTVKSTDILEPKITVLR